MNLSHLDLDIQNYSISDLESFLHLKNNYGEQQVNEKIQIIQNKVLKNSTLDNSFHSRFIIFLEEVKDILMNKNIKKEKSKLENGSGDHSILKQENTPVANTYNYLYPGGIVNPIERRVITKVICIDSLFRENYKNTNSNNFIWNLHNPQNHVISIKIVALEIPVVWYSFSTAKKNNFFNISFFNIKGQADSTQTVVIPDGNYMSNDFVTMINNLFTNIGHNLQYLYFDINIFNSCSIIRAKNTVTDGNASLNLYDPTNLLFSPDFYFKVNFNTNEKKCDDSKYNFNKTAGWMLGFRHESYTVTFNDLYTDNISSNVPYLFNAYLQSESSYGSAINNYIFIMIDDFNKNMITDSITSGNVNNTTSYLGNNILARITVTNSFNSTLNDNASDRIFKTREYLGPIYLKKLNISLLDKYGDYVDLNNNNFSFALELSILY